MLTPQAVAEHTFTKARFGGYTMQEVDDFLDEITKDYGALYEENAELKGKLKVLADKITEYRETEDIMRVTLHNAQKTANDIVTEAESKREGILDALEQDIRARKQAYDDEIAVCRAQLAEARKKTTEYLAMIQDLTDQQQAFLSDLPDLGQGGDLTEPEEEDEAPSDGEAPAAEPEQGEEQPAGADAAEEPEQEQEQTPPPAEPEQPAERSAAATTRIDFSNLKFGKDYEIK